MVICGSPILRQYLVIITANLSFVSIGLSVGWCSPVLVKLMNQTETVLSRPITYEEGSWIASIGHVCGLILNFTIGFLMDKLGRKTCLILGFVPRLIMCFMLLFAQEVWVFYVARAFDGLANACIIAAVPTYSSEIASKECRGALGTISQIASGLGMLIFLSIGPFLPYFELHVMYICVTATICLPLWFIPETPYYLYSKGHKKKSLSTLIYLRGSEAVALEEMKQYSLSQSKISKKEIFGDRITLKTLGKVVFLSIFFDLIGYNAVIVYMQTILQSTQTSVSEQISSVVNGCLQLVASFCTIFLTDRFGRKPILIVTLFGMALGMIGLGTFFQLKSASVPTVGFLNFLPLISMMLVVFCFNAGMGSLCWTVVAELFDGPARAVGASVAIGVATSFAFLITKYFVNISFAIGVANVYWIFTCNCVIIVLFILFFIPETKGKTFTEIQGELGRRIEKADLK